MRKSCPYWCRFSLSRTPECLLHRRPSLGPCTVQRIVRDDIIVVLNVEGQVGTPIRLTGTCSENLAHDTHLHQRLTLQNYRNVARQVCIKLFSQIISVHETPGLTASTSEAPSQPEATNMRALDEDTQLMICSRLDLKSLGRLRRVRDVSSNYIMLIYVSIQVSHHFNKHISRSKTLWLSILDREILSRGLPLHQGRIHIESATAEQIESWVKCALVPQKAYSTGASSEVSRVNLELCVTWLKVVRARRCIVAASNTEQSRLSLIDLYGDLRICKEMQLPGPVLSGAFEDQHNWLSLALTIGAT